MLNKHLEAQRAKRLKVLINPFGGSGMARKVFKNDVEQLLIAAHCEVDVEHTQHRGHGIEIAQNLDISKFDAVVCISGDGLPHEVFNGLGKRRDALQALRKIAV